MARKQVPHAFAAVMTYLCVIVAVVVIHVHAAPPPIIMAGPMTGPGQVPWDSDLGVPLIYKGGTWFLEGDSFTNGNFLTDGNVTNVGDPVGNRVAGNAIGGCKPLPCKVIWYLNAQHYPIMFITWPPKVISCVPAGTIEANGVSYIWMMNVIQWGGVAGTHAWSMLLTGSPTPANYVASNSVYFEVDSKFVNAGFVNTGTTIYIYGTGLYRVSDIFLASVPTAQFGNKGAWKYYTGNNNWSANEGDAKAIITGSMAGEISAIYSTYLKQYVITAFGFGKTLGLFMYRSSNPAGPWTSEIIFDESWSYSWKVKMSGQYGGYMVPDQGVSTPTLWMTLSFWVPYRTYMVSTDLSKLGSNESVITGLYDSETGETQPTISFSKNPTTTENQPRINHWDMTLTKAKLFNGKYPNNGEPTHILLNKH